MKSISRLTGAFLGTIVGVFLLMGIVMAADQQKKVAPPVAKCVQCQDKLNAAFAKQLEMKAFDKKHMNELKATDMKAYKQLMLAKTVLKDEKKALQGKNLSPKQRLVQDAVLKYSDPEMYKLDQEFKALAKIKFECEKTCPTK
ncbi:MAG: hypothetical protein HQL21_04105 [Candidatus Omnitrophica bacterium]|nr:hypothetical protein [Candidatus Omnitrophota bacterium]